MAGTWFTNEFAQEVWEKKYSGTYSDVEKYYADLARMISLGDNNLQAKFFQLMWDKKFSPAGRILAFAGRPGANMSLMNCTTHAVEGDSLETINRAGFTIMKASSRGQGIGVDLSKLRPKEAPVNNAAKTSTGAISFMEMLDQIASVIGQEGRRAALLFSLRVDHPDLWRPGQEDVVVDGKSFQYDFLNIKKIPGKVENANISVLITDEFMRAVKEDKMWQMNFTGISGNKPFTKYSDRFMAKDLFRAIAEAAWTSAEPGLLMWDTSKEFSNSDIFGEKWGIRGVNACTEQVLDQEGVCNLGSINLGNYVVNQFTDDAYFDFEAFEEDVQVAIEFLDNVLTVELQKGSSISNKQEEAIKKLRRVGLGVMGLADAIAMMGLEYGMDEETEKFMRRVFTSFRDASYMGSVELAYKHGPAPVWENQNVEEVLEQGFFKTLPAKIKEEIIEAGGTRNITVMSIAPTGSISNLVGVSSGIEPLFAHEYKRRVRISGKDEFVDYVHPGVEQSRLMGLDDEIWPTAYEVSPEEHVQIQALAQEYIDQSISKTVNLPEDATVEDVMEVYMMSWMLGAKGVSVYRDGSRWEQVLYTEKDDEREDKGACPECGNGIIFRDGCRECLSCGWSVCEI